MARREIKVRTFGSLVNGVLNVGIELEDDKGNWLPLTVPVQTADSHSFQGEADLANLIDLSAFDKAVKAHSDAQDAKTQAILAAQNAAVEPPAPPVKPDINLVGGTFTGENGETVTVTPINQPSQDALDNTARVEKLVNGNS